MRVYVRGNKIIQKRRKGTREQRTAQTLLRMARRSGRSKGSYASARTGMRTVRRTRREILLGCGIVVGERGGEWRCDVRESA